MDKVKGALKTAWRWLFGRYERVVDFTDYIEDRDIKQSRITAALGYICFIIPLVFHDDKQFARFHCNQSIINLLFSTLGAVALGLIPTVGPILVLIQEILCIIYAVRGFMIAWQGKAKSIPFIGWITILAYRYPGQ